MMLNRGLFVLLALGGLSCADVPEAPDVAGVNIAAVDFQPETVGTVQLRFSMADRFGYPWLDMPTTRVYVRQQLLNGTVLRSIIEPDEQTAASACGWLRPAQAPTAIAFVVDRSGLGDELTYRTYLRGVRESIVDAPDDMRLAVVHFGDTVSVDAQMSADHDAALEALADPSVARGRSALFAGIEAGIDLAAAAAPGEYGAVVVVASTLDDVAGTSTSFDSVTKRARNAGVPVYVVAYGDATLGAGSELMALDDLASGSGGRYVAGGDAVFSTLVIGSVLSSVRSAYEVCFDALPVDQGNRYADGGDMAQISLTIESLGSDIETVRTF